VIPLLALALPFLPSLRIQEYRKPCSCVGGIIGARLLKARLRHLVNTLGVGAIFPIV